jgi:hypothetical protein
MFTSKWESRLLPVKQDSFRARPVCCFPVQHTAASSACGNRCTLTPLNMAATLCQPFALLYCRCQGCLNHEDSNGSLACARLFLAHTGSTCPRCSASYCGDCAVSCGLCATLLCRGCHRCDNCEFIVCGDCVDKAICAQCEREFCSTGPCGFNSAFCTDCGALTCNECAESVSVFHCDGPDCQHKSCVRCCGHPGRQVTQCRACMSLLCGSTSQCQTSQCRSCKAPLCRSCRECGRAHHCVRTVSP